MSEQGEEVLVTVLICANAGAEGRHADGHGGAAGARCLFGHGCWTEDAATEGMELALVKEKLTMVHRQVRREGRSGVEGGCMKIVGQVMQVDEMQDENDAVSLCSMFAGDESFGIDTRKIREVLGKRELQRVPMAPAFIARRGAVSRRGADDGELSRAAGDGRAQRQRVACWCWKTMKAQSGLAWWWMRWAAW